MGSEMCIRDRYSDSEFRHRYSGITRCIYSGDNNLGPQSYTELQAVSRQANRLILNLSAVREIVVSDSDSYNHKNFLPCLEKLYDHVYLEYTRLNTLDSPYSNIEELTSQAKALTESSKKVQTKTTKLAKKVKGSQKDYIAILAIFSAVIMAFAGGLNFIAGSFSAIGSIDLKSLLCIVSIIGLVLIDVFYVLIAFVWGIIRMDSDNKSIPTSLPIVIIANSLMILLFVITFPFAIT